MIIDTIIPILIDIPIPIEYKFVQNAKMHALITVNAKLKNINNDAIKLPLFLKIIIIKIENHEFNNIVGDVDQIKLIPSFLTKSMFG